jgi:GDP-D-mannose dehydratase
MVSRALQLGITRVALASSVNAIGLVFNQTRVFDYFPIDEAHPCRPDEAYGVSKLYARRAISAVLALI